MNQYLHHPLITILLLCALNTILNACSTNQSIPLYSKLPSTTAQTTDIVHLIVPIEIDLIYHNGQNIDLLPAYQAKVKYSLLTGEHLLGFQYQDLHYNDDENQEIITSRAVYIYFTANANNTYHINFKAPQNYAEAKLLENNLELKLSLNNTIIAISNLNKHTATNMAFNTTQPSPTVKELKSLWIKANPKEQHIFMQWIDNN